MPAIATMTDARDLLRYVKEPSGPLPGGRMQPSRNASDDNFVRMTPSTIHVNIGRIEVPRSLPPTRSIATQTDDSEVAGIKASDAKAHKKAFRFAKKYVWPCVVFLWTVITLIIGRFGFGIRLN